MTSQPNLDACARIAAAIITAATDYRRRLHLTNHDPLTATVPPTLTAAEREWIAARTEAYNVQVDTVTPRPHDPAVLGDTVQFLLHQPGTWGARKTAPIPLDPEANPAHLGKITSSGPLPLGAEDVPRDGARP